MRIISPLAKMFELLRGFILISPVGASTISGCLITLPLGIRL